MLTPSDITSSTKYSYSFSLNGVYFYFDIGKGDDFSYSSGRDGSEKFDISSSDELYLFALADLKKKFNVNLKNDFVAYRHILNSGNYVFIFHYSCVMDDICQTGIYLLPHGYESYKLKFVAFFDREPTGEYTLPYTTHTYPYDDGSKLIGHQSRPLYSYYHNPDTGNTDSFLLQYVYDSNYSYITGEDGFQYLVVSLVVKYFAVSMPKNKNTCCIAVCFGITE